MPWYACSEDKTVCGNKVKAGHPCTSTEICKLVEESKAEELKITHANIIHHHSKAYFKSVSLE